MLWINHNNNIDYGFGLVDSLIEANKSDDALEELKRMPPGDPRLDYWEAKANYGINDYVEQRNAATRAIG